MAARIIAQLIVNGTAILSKAFYSAYQQALRNAKAGGGPATTQAVQKFKMRPDEALKILHIDQHELSKQLVQERFDKFFKLNDPKKGGSFYLQSKIYRSKEVLDSQFEPKVETANREDEKDENSSGNGSENSKP